LRIGKKSAIKILMILLGALLVVTTVAGCGDKAPTEPVVFADLGWDSALVHNQIAAFILENSAIYRTGTRRHRCQHGMLDGKPAGSL
jgi:ABC-type proline/glycine betaine transport system substrate-binding protein